MRRAASFLAHALDGDDDTRLAAFLADYWRRDALVLPGALEALECPLDADELAGIACEPEVDARIVRTTRAGYELEQGPFDAARFSELGDENWTLLVNAVDLHVPGFEPWLEAARFVPDWRLDDVMVSFAAPGGSVGPHLDRYDVFLLQAEGDRDWHLGPRPSEETRIPRARDGLMLIDDFEAQRSFRSGTGDGLYVPAGCVHHGVARTPSLTVSIGFRAPSLATLADGWFDHLLEGLDDTPLDLDPSLPSRPAHLAPETVEAARQALSDAITTRLSAVDFPDALGRLLTEPSRGALLDPPDRRRDAPWLAARLAAGERLERAPGVRLLIHEPAAGRSTVFCTGEQFELAVSADALAVLAPLTPIGAELCDAPSSALDLAVELYNRGMLRLTDPAS